MAMKVFAVTDGAAAADVNEYMVNTKYTEKAAGTTRVSTTTLTADPDLQIHLDTNKTYWMELIAPFTSPAAAGFKFSFFVPAGTVFTGYALVTGAGALSLFTYSSGGNLITLNVNSASAGAGVDDQIIVRGTLDTAGSAGNIGYQWAQLTSNGGNTIVRAGSAMYIRRVS
jgi:hypothetical protein